MTREEELANEVKIVQAYVGGSAYTMEEATRKNIAAAIRKGMDEVRSGEQEACSIVLCDLFDSGRSEDRPPEWQAGVTDAIEMLRRRHIRQNNKQE